MTPSLLTLLSDYNCSDGPVTPQSELFADLGIWGDDAVELLEKYSEQFGVSLEEFPFTEYFPCEGDQLRWRWPWQKRRTFRPLTVADLERGIEQGRLL